MSKGDLLTLAQNAFKSGAKGRTVLMLRQLVRDNPPLKGRWRDAANLAASVLDVQTAAHAQERFLEFAPNAPVNARLSLVRFLHESGHFEQAKTMAESLYAEFPDHPNVVYAMGFVQARLNNLDEYIAHYRRAVDMDPKLSTAWSVLIKMRKDIESPDDPDFAAMRRTDWALNGEAGVSRAPVRFGMGFAYDKLGWSEAAFANIRSGSEMMRAELSQDYDRVDQLFAAIQTHVTKDVIDAAEGIDTDRPIFVIGAPRAGTTLMESILTAHSAVHDGAELNNMSIASLRPHIALTRHGGAFDERLREADGPRHLSQVGELYLQMANERWGDGVRFVDSSTATPWQTGWIMASMPNARIIWMTRNRLDALWAIYKVHFATAQEFSYDFRAINQRLDRLLSLRDHFQSIRTDQILPVAYEDLVSDPETWIARVLEHCGLPDEPGVRDFHKSGRVVSTASSQQVTEPISTKSIGSWRRYEAQLSPIYRDLLGESFEAYQEKRL